MCVDSTIYRFPKKNKVSYFLSDADRFALIHRRCRFVENLQSYIEHEIKAKFSLQSVTRSCKCAIAKR